MKSLFHRVPYLHPVKRPARRTTGTGSKSFYHNELERDIYFALGGNSGNTLPEDGQATSRRRAGLRVKSELGSARSFLPSRHLQGTDEEHACYRKLSQSWLPPTGAWRAREYLPDHVPAMPLFCRILTTTLRFSAWPSVVALVPIAPGARIFVSGIFPSCSRNAKTLSAGSMLSF
jgi:hypothetical protein